MINMDYIEHKEEFWRSRPPNIRYTNVALAQVILPYENESTNKQVWTKAKKKSKLTGSCMTENNGAN